MRIALAAVGLVFAAPVLAKTAQSTDRADSAPAAAPKTSPPERRQHRGWCRPGDEDLKAPIGRADGQEEQR